MKSAFFVSLLALSSLSLGGCIEEGHSADCSVGGRGNLEDEGCVTPVGGGCISEAEFKASRPSTREDASGTERTINDDWIAYQFERPQCDFECMTEEEFLNNRSDDVDPTWTSYLELRPDCAD